MTIEDQVQLALAAPYTRICRRDEDGGVSAEVAELPGCYASGATIAEAMEELHYSGYGEDDLFFDERHVIVTGNDTCTIFQGEMECVHVAPDR